MPNNYFPTTGMSTMHAGTQSAPTTDNYNLMVANVLPNNQPYYVPGSGSSKTYAPGEIPDLTTPPPINPNVYKMGQQHLDQWKNSFFGGSGVPYSAPVQDTPQPMPGSAPAVPFQNANPTQNPQSQGDIPASGTQNPQTNFDLNAFLASIQPPGQSGNSSVANSLFGVLNGSPSSGTGRYSSATNWFLGPQQQT